MGNVYLKNSYNNRLCVYHQTIIGRKNFQTVKFQDRKFQDRKFPDRKNLRNIGVCRYQIVGCHPISNYRIFTSIVEIVTIIVMVSHIGKISIINKKDMVGCLGVLT